jgi:ABC-type sugar transport system ATPase subunit
VSKAATTKVKISDDFEIECESFDFNVSEWVDAMFRPEQCIISTTPLEGINVWKGIIKKTFFLGNLTDVYFEIGSIELRAQISPPKQLFVGQTIWTHIQPNSIRMYRH